MKELRVSFNFLSGQIPNFQNLLNLESLIITQNNLSGQIPDFNLPKLKNLRFNDSDTFNDIFFVIDNNDFSGVLPNFSYLESLETLHIAGNNLSGILPSFNHLSNLRVLNCLKNNLTGTIPNFDTLTSLEVLNLYGNNLEGSVPNFNHLEYLVTLNVAKNNLDGIIPNFDKLPNLQELQLNNNQLSGSIPNFDSLVSLQILQLCPNNLTGNIPAFHNCELLDASEIDFSCVMSAKTTGTTFADLDGDCVKDEKEPTIPNVIIGTNDSSSYAFSDENGFYTLKTDTGIYEFDCFVPNYLWQRSCESYTNAFTIHPQSLEDSIGGFDFGFRPLVECPLMLVDVGTPLLRPCYRNTYTIHYCNTGTAAAENAEIHLDISEDIIPLESSLPYNFESDNVLVFDIGTVGIGECGTFTLTDSLSCEAIVGSTACVEAQAFPNDFCFENTSLWDGSDLEIDAVCTGDSVIFTITNVGEDMEDESTYRMYEADVLSTFEGFQLLSNQSLQVGKAANGNTFRLTAHQHDNHPISDFVTAVVELCGADIDMAALGFVNTQSNINYKHFYDMYCEQILESYEPNNTNIMLRSVGYEPNNTNIMLRGVGDEHRITASQELEYKINFQNVDTTAAFKLVIIDTIDTDFLNINTLKLGVSSHDYTAEIKDGNVLIFTFENIFLADSETNEPDSHGFVMFKISQKTGNQKNDVIKNRAAIYFNYNQPIITNTAFNTIGLPDKTTNVPIVTRIEKDIPASVFYENAYLHINISVAPSSEQYSATIYDVLGKQIAHEKQIFGFSHKMLVGNLPKGVYLFEIEGSSGKKASSKFMVR